MNRKADVTVEIRWSDGTVENVRIENVLEEDLLVENHWFHGFNLSVAPTPVVSDGGA